MQDIEYAKAVARQLSMRHINKIVERSFSYAPFSFGMAHQTKYILMELGLVEQALVSWIPEPLYRWTELGLVVQSLILENYTQEERLAIASKGV